ncbi:MAG: hypothetical protein IPP52_14245 [Ignavibacteria bacterium]|nr:hypothetical protein [Ignavibacteria bacterium]
MLDKYREGIRIARSGPSKETINNNTFSNITTGGAAFMGISTGSSGA